jgi:hypothetical protein
MDRAGAAHLGCAGLGGNKIGLIRLMRVVDRQEALTGSFYDATGVKCNLFFFSLLSVRAHVGRYDLKVIFLLQVTCCLGTNFVARPTGGFS